MWLAKHGLHLTAHAGESAGPDLFGAKQNVMVEGTIKHYVLLPVALVEQVCTLGQPRA